MSAERKALDELRRRQQDLRVELARVTKAVDALSVLVNNNRPARSYGGPRKKPLPDRILDELENGPGTRQQLAKRMGLAPATISEAFLALRQLDKVVAEGSGGRGHAHVYSLPPGHDVPK